VCVLHKRERERARERERERERESITHTTQSHTQSHTHTHTHNHTDNQTHISTPLGLQFDAVSDGTKFSKGSVLVFFSSQTHCGGRVSQKSVPQYT
jgi:hypothetical protein